MVRDLQLAEVVMTGELATGKLISPISTSTVAVGTPLLQLDAVDQLVLVVPCQLVWAKEIVPVNNKRLTKNNGFSHILFFIYWIYK